MLIPFVRRLYNLIAIKFFFILLCIASLIAGPLMFPLTILFPNTGHLKARQIIGKAIRIYFLLLNKAGLHKLSIAKIKNDTPSIYISNHSSLLDALYYMGYFPEICAIIKNNLFFLSPFSLTSFTAKYISNKTNEHTVDKAVSTLRKGESIFIFPDGTRRPQGEKINLKRGAIMIALKSKAPLIYGKIVHSEPILEKDSPFFYAPKHLIKADMSFYPIPSKLLKIKEGETLWIASRRISKELESYLNSI